MAISVHQSTGVLGTEGDTSVNVSFSSTPTSGRYVVVCANVQSAHQDLGTISASDNQGNTYTARYTYTSANRRKHIYFTAPISTSSGTFTVTVSVSDMEAWAGTRIKFSISEASGLDSADYVDQSGSGSGSSTSATVSLATMNSDTMVFAICTQEWDVSMTRADGWSAVYEPNNVIGIIRREGDYDPSWTLGLSNNWLASAVGFNAAASASGNPWYYYAQQMRQKLEEKLKRRILIPGFADCVRYGYSR